MAHAGLWLLAGVLLGSVTGAATATFLAPRELGMPQESAADFGARVAASMEKAVERTVERVQQEAAAAREAAPSDYAAPAGSRVSGDPAPESHRRRMAAPERADDPSDSGDAPLVRDGSVAMPAKDASRLEQFVVRSRDACEARRRDWMFVGEKAVAAALGVPDSVSQDDHGREEWSYDIPYVNADGEQDSYTLEFTFSKGRVVEIQGAVAIPE